MAGGVLDVSELAESWRRMARRAASDRNEMSLLSSEAAARSQHVQQMH